MAPSVKRDDGRLLLRGLLLVRAALGTCDFTWASSDERYEMKTLRSRLHPATRRRPHPRVETRLPGELSTVVARGAAYGTACVTGAT